MSATSSNKGHTAIEIVIALGLVGIVAMIIFKLSQDVLQYIHYNQIATTRDQLTSQFRQDAGRLANLQLSLSKSENSDFHNCVCGTGSGCDTTKNFSLSLYDKSTPATPIATYYDAAGIPCNKNAGNCVIEVTTGFIAQCMPILPSSNPTPPVICVGAPAEFVAVSFTVRQNPLTLSRGQVIKSISSTVFTPVATLAPTGSGVCP